jgi:hypothetical protein
MTAVGALTFVTPVDNSPDEKPSKRTNTEEIANLRTREHSFRSWHNSGFRFSDMPVGKKTTGLTGSDSSCNSQQDEGESDE